MSNIFATPIQRSFTKGAQKSINDFNQLQGKNLPCHVTAVSGSIVTVAFDIKSGYTLPTVVMPIFGAEWIRLPIQVGCTGVAISANASLGGNSGLGYGIADLSQQANLAALVFFPIGNTQWSAVDPDAIVLYGNNGAVIRDSSSNSIITLTPAGIVIVGQQSVSISSGSSAMVVNADGSWSVSGTGAGAISAQEGLTLSDGLNVATLSAMKLVFNVMIDWMNTHVHADPQGGFVGVADPQYSGGNPIG